MQLIDTHCHIDLPIFEDDFFEVLGAARQASITKMILPGVSGSGWQRLLDLCSKEEDLLPAIGLHPMYLAHHSKEHIDELQSHMDSQPLVALGEIGLDYFVEGVNRDKQQELFETQLQMAKKAKLPVLLHVRKAHDQVLATLRRSNFSHGGIAHAFNGSMQQAKQYIGLGFKISFSGTVTYDRAKNIRRLATTLDLSDIVIESDAPDLPPASHHGQRNTPANLALVLDCLAELRQQPKEVIASATSENTRTLLHI